MSRNPQGPKTPPPQAGERESREKQTTMDAQELAQFVIELREDADGWADLAAPQGRDHFAFHGVARMLRKAADELEFVTTRLSEENHENGRPVMEVSFQIPQVGTIGHVETLIQDFLDAQFPGWGSLLILGPTNHCYHPDATGQDALRGHRTRGTIKGGGQITGKRPER